MDCYASRTFLKAVTKVAAALIKRQNFEVSESVLRSFTCCILFVSTPLMKTHTRFPHLLLPYRLRLPRNTCVSSQAMHLPTHLWEWTECIRLEDTPRCMVLLSWGVYNSGGHSWRFTVCPAITLKILSSPQVVWWKGISEICKTLHEQGLGDSSVISMADVDVKIQTAVGEFWI